jgi:hypothetical protein
MGVLAVCWSGLDSVEQIEGARHHAQVIDDYSYLCCLDGFARLSETPATPACEASGRGSKK